MRTRSRKKILIIQRQVKQYRVPFFELLYRKLADDGISLCVAYSAPPEGERQKKDNCDLPPEFGIKVKAYWVLRQRILWQPLLKQILKSDLVVVEQANKFLLNHLLLLCSACGIKRMAFWGLGENKQSGKLPVSEWYRQKTLDWPDWWFAYTRGTSDYLMRNGVPREKITSVQNSVDTRELQEQIASIPRDRICNERKKLGITIDAPVGVFCGMLDPVKSVPFLIESAKLVKKRLPGFHLILAGGGPDAQFARQAAADTGGWIHAVGPKFGSEKALILRMGDVFTLPGRVGLAILDAFAAGLPLLTTSIPIHGPEVEYLADGINGLTVEHNIVAYADAVTSILSDSSRLRALKKGAAKSAEEYSIEAMAQNFHEGITRCLSTA